MDYSVHTDSGDETDTLVGFMPPAAYHSPDGITEAAACDIKYSFLWTAQNWLR